jgi:X-Pro dipeptidyl-peptidase
MADIERTPDHWTTDRVWPPRTTDSVRLSPAKGSAAGVGTLGLKQGSGTEVFTDDPKLSETDWAAQIDKSTPGKAGFISKPLGKDLRLSGSSKVTVTATPSTTTAHLSAVLVDLGPATIRDYADGGEGITTLTDRTCWGASTAGDSSCFLRTEAKTADVDRTVFSRGWADLGTYASERTGKPLTPGKPYTITLDLAPSDHVVPAGHRLALIVAGTDKDLIDPPSTTPTLTLDLSRTVARVPLVGGADAFAAATSGSAKATPRATAPDGVSSLRPSRPIPGGTH